jgi:hypothetical protein
MASENTPRDRTTETPLEPHPARWRPAPMPNHPSRKASFLLLPVIAVAVMACSAGGSATPAPSGATDGSPSTPPSATPNADLIDHPTGATDIVLRYEEGGGFMIAGYAATMVPHFTLYGDGTIVYRDPFVEVPAMEGNVGKANPLRTAKLTEAQVQDVLRLALTDGGLAVARPEYRNDMVADASTAVFTIQAGGLTKTVSVYALGLDDGPDAPARAAFSRLAETLTKIEDGGVISGTDYVPTAYRGVLLENAGVIDVEARAWPWDDIAPADFVQDADPNSGLAFPHRTMTPEEVDALGIIGYEGGLQNVTLLGPDGMAYAFSLRPLLPDEDE